jgi:hypothetical protein
VSGNTLFGVAMALDKPDRKKGFFDENVVNADSCVYVVQMRRNEVLHKTSANATLL